MSGCVIPSTCLGILACFYREKASLCKSWWFYLAHIVCCVVKKIEELNILSCAGLSPFLSLAMWHFYTKRTALEIFLLHHDASCVPYPLFTPLFFVPILNGIRVCLPSCPRASMQAGDVRVNWRTVNKPSIELSKGDMISCSGELNGSSVLLNWSPQ